MTETVLKQLTIGKMKVKLTQRQTGFAVVLPMAIMLCDKYEVARKNYREIVKAMIYKARESTNHSNVDSKKQ